MEATANSSFLPTALIVLGVALPNAETGPSSV